MASGIDWPRGAVRESTSCVLMDAPAVRRTVAVRNASRFPRHLSLSLSLLSSIPPSSFSPDASTLSANQSRSRVREARLAGGARRCGRNPLFLYQQVLLLCQAFALLSIVPLPLRLNGSDPGRVCVCVCVSGPYPSLPRWSSSGTGGP